VEEANRFVEHARPWRLARAERDGDAGAAAELDAALSALLDACRDLAEHLAVFLPDAAARVAVQCTPVGGRLPAPQPLFPRRA
jgi:methionyl-tRNA synthetase